MVGVKHKIAIISGKGGVGKTSLTVNLGRALLERG
ncbi:MAG TPA: P-loop NTPase [Chloroflexota bacterium]|nr:P-loop NTPase [Chloroflexota bacterium]